MTGRIIKAIASVIAGGIMIVSSIFSFINRRNEEKRNQDAETNRGSYCQYENNNQTNYRTKPDPQSRRYMYKEDTSWENIEQKLSNNNPTQDNINNNSIPVGGFDSRRYCQSNNNNNGYMNNNQVNPNYPYGYGYADDTVTNTHTCQNNNSPYGYGYGYADNTVMNNSAYNNPRAYSNNYPNGQMYVNNNPYFQNNTSNIIKNNKSNHVDTIDHGEISKAFKEMFGNNSVSNQWIIESDNESIRDDENLNDGVVPMFVIPPESLYSGNRKEA